MWDMKVIKEDWPMGYSKDFDFIKVLSLKYYKAKELNLYVLLWPGPLVMSLCSRDLHMMSLKYNT